MSEQYDTSVKLAGSDANGGSRSVDPLVSCRRCGPVGYYTQNIVSYRQYYDAESPASIGAYPRYPDEEIIRCIDELRTGIPAWFAANPSRKICKVDLFYGRSIDVRRENWSARLDSEQAKLIGKSNGALKNGGKAKDEQR